MDHGGVPGPAVPGSDTGEGERRFHVYVYSIWESRFPNESIEEGLEVTRAIWDDMRGFEGYLDQRSSGTSTTTPAT